MEEKKILSNEEINKVVGGGDAMLEGQDKRRKECSSCKKATWQVFVCRCTGQDEYGKFYYCDVLRCLECNNVNYFAVNEIV